VVLERRLAGTLEDGQVVPLREVGRRRLGSTPPAARSEVGREWPSVSVEQKAA
jgi:hypothetical protein